LSVVTLLFDWGLKLRTNPEPDVPNPRINLAGKTIIPLALRTQSSDILELLIEKAYQQLGLDGAYAFLRDGLQDWIHLPIDRGDIRMCQLLKEHKVPIASSQLPCSQQIQIIQPKHHETIRPLIADKPILAFTLGIT
ncbi:MAG TPA: hypothetical protein PLO43_04395, partial [Chlamydiales bacterium]|nr:hypothetical protein [Chlamydiales bacterium]